MSKKSNKENNHPANTELQEEIIKFENDYYDNMENETFRASLSSAQIEEAEKKYFNKNICNFTIAHQIPDDFDVDGFIRYLSTLTYIQNYAFIIHDKDVSKDGRPAKRHYHIFCQCPQQKAINMIARDFDVLPYVVQKMKASDKNYYRATQYLVHLNNPEKYQYPFEDVRASFDYRKKVFRDLNQSNNSQIKSTLLKQILAGQIKRYEEDEYFKINHIPEEFHVYWKRDIDNAFKISDDLYLKKHKNRELECYYIYGESKLGKSALARDIAFKRGYQYFQTGSGNDILDGYRDEEVIIVDDARSEMFSSYSDVLRLLEPHSNTKYKSRFYNKTLKAKIIIFTSTQPISSVFSFSKNQNEDHFQIYRRIKHYIHVKKDYCEHYKINERTKKYNLVQILPNPLEDVIKRENAQKSENNDNWMLEAYGSYTGNIPLLIIDSKNADEDGCYKNFVLKDTTVEALKEKGLLDT